MLPRRFPFQGPFEGDRASSACPLRVLVVEDSRDDYELLCATLARQGIHPEARRVEDEPGMVDALAAGPWDIVLSDHALPRFSSLDAIRVVAESGLDIPLIIVSGAIGEETAVAAMRAGADDYLVKGKLARLGPAILRCVDAAGVRRARRKAEAALNASAANLPGVLFRLSTDRSGSIVAVDYVSQGALPLFGYLPAELIGAPDRLLALLDPAGLATLKSGLKSAAATGSTWRQELQVVADSGRRHWVQLAASPRGEGADLLWDGVMTDITALKEAEARLIASEESLRKLSAHVLRVKEQERAEVARDIHDDIGGTLTALRAELDSLKKRIAETEARERIERIDHLVAGAIKSSQAISRALRPSALDHGIYPALAWQAGDFEERLGIPVRIEANDRDVVLDPEASTALYRIFQEALTNIAKHAKASRVEATLFTNRDMVSLEVRDNGTGLAPAELDKRASFGVMGMRERARALGGWLEIDSTPASGTTLMVTLPRQAVAAGTAA
jgi:PAS domain S-box-containing protein